MNIIPSLPSIEARLLFDVPLEKSGRMKRAMQRINEMRKVLGPNDRWILTKAINSPSIQQWTWKCGCLVECTGNDRDYEPVFDWNPCGGHPESGYVECLRAQQSLPSV